MRQRSPPSWNRRRTGSPRRWARRSASKNLSLNTKLLFLSPDLVRYVLIHELCHTVHMNHSGDFWRLVACHEPGYRVLDQALRAAWKTVPQWTFWKERDSDVSR